MNERPEPLINQETYQSLLLPVIQRLSNLAGPGSNHQVTVAAPGRYLVQVQSLDTQHIWSEWVYEPKPEPVKEGRVLSDEHIKSVARAIYEANPAMQWLRSDVVPSGPTAVPWDELDAFSGYGGEGEFDYGMSCESFRDLAKAAIPAVLEAAAVVFDDMDSGMWCPVAADWLRSMKETQ